MVLVVPMVMPPPLALRLPVLLELLLSRSLRGQLLRRPGEPPHRFLQPNYLLRLYALRSASATGTGTGATTSSAKTLQGTSSTGTGAIPSQSHASSAAAFHYAPVGTLAIGAAAIVFTLVL